MSASTVPVEYMAFHSASQMSEQILQHANIQSHLSSVESLLDPIMVQNIWEDIDRVSGGKLIEEIFRFHPSIPEWHESQIPLVLLGVAIETEEISEAEAELEVPESGPSGPYPSQIERLSWTPEVKPYNPSRDIYLSRT
ncbi:hypothetical protein C8J56DRAFT_1065129 [Mycena floridula]|nr:hypothetical protein C8J56DRAFT_1065129 [Mycena floridula]